MSGIRIRHSHPNARSATLTLATGRPLRIPHDCPQCHKQHPTKTYHLVLDDTGSTIVSPEVLEQLKRLPKMGGFTVESEVKDPPPQRVIVGGPIIVDRPAVLDAAVLERGR